mgnify:FL=1
MSFQFSLINKRSCILKSNDEGDDKNSKCKSRYSFKSGTTLKSATVGVAKTLTSQIFLKVIPHLNCISITLEDIYFLISLDESIEYKRM